DSAVADVGILFLEQTLTGGVLKGQETGAELFESAGSFLEATRLFFVEARRNLFEFRDLCLELSEPLPEDGRANICGPLPKLLALYSDLIYLMKGGENKVSETKERVVPIGSYLFVDLG